MLEDKGVAIIAVLIPISKTSQGARKRSGNLGYSLHHLSTTHEMIGEGTRDKGITKNSGP